MNVNVFVIHLVIMLLLPNVLTKTVAESSAIDSEPEENERLDDTEALHETHRHGLKRNKEAVKKHNRRGRSSENGKQCAIMYKNEEPVGILQRFDDSYQLLPISNEEKIPVDISPMEKINSEEVKQDTKRHTDFNGENSEGDLAQFSDEKYPTIFAKFKIDSRVEKEGNQKSKNLEKRESKGSSLFSENDPNSLRSALSRIESNHESAAVDLKGILNDMGLIEDPQVGKRAAQLVEDEDLEHGNNKINLVKVENSDSQRPKRGKADKRSQKQAAVTKHYGMIEIPEPKSINEDEYIDEYLNKHPDQAKQLDQQREKRSEDLGAQMERQIKERLQKIKEEVRSEIEKIKANSNGELDEEEEDDDDEEGKSQRKKRNIVSNLMEEETSDLDPVLIGDNSSPHIRRRRGLDMERLLAADAPKLPVQITAISPPVATTEHFSLRRLKEFSETHYEDTQNDEGLDDGSAIRTRKACKCAGKDCKCGKSPAAANGNNFFYIDGAPLLTNYQVAKPAVAEPEQLPSIQKQRPLRDSEHEQKSASKSLANGRYVLDLEPEAYKIRDVDGRKKRSNFMDLVALHGDHLVAIKRRSMEPKMRAKRMAEGKEQLTLMDMSAEDLFGALPQGFDGELTRLKRVKRK